MNKQYMTDLFSKYGAVVFFDTETTRLDAETCRVIELAAIRMEQDVAGKLYIQDKMDMFVKLPDGECIPPKITELTGITDIQLKENGNTENEVLERFAKMLGNGPAVLVAYNAQFDLAFMRAAYLRHETIDMDSFLKADYLDSLTVYRDRRPYPHKLMDAITAYKLDRKVQNSHRAIDDVEALFEVCKAMCQERDNLLTYVNIFGFNPKYGISGRKMEKVKYFSQDVTHSMQLGRTLPERCITVNRQKYKQLERKDWHMDQFEEEL